MAREPVAGASLGVVPLRFFDQFGTATLAFLVELLTSCVRKLADVEVFYCPIGGDLRVWASAEHEIIIFVSQIPEQLLSLNVEVSAEEKEMLS